MRTLLSLPLLLIASIGVSGCLGDETADEANTEEASTKAASEAPPAVEEKTIYIVGTDLSLSPEAVYKMRPAQSTAQLGDHINLTFKSAVGNQYQHNLVIDEFQVRTKTIGAGDSTFVVFDAAKSGLFKYYCAVGQHRLFGMEGTLTIS